MIFSSTSITSYELLEYHKDTISKIRQILEEELKEFQSEWIEEYFVTFFCNSPRFAQFDKMKRPRFTADKTIVQNMGKFDYTRHYYKYLEVDCLLDWDSIYNATEEECPRVAGELFMKCLEDMKYPKRSLQFFEKDAFNTFVRAALTKHGYL